MNGRVQPAGASAPFTAFGMTTTGPFGGRAAALEAQCPADAPAET
jgi:hypothetical protein